MFRNPEDEVDKAVFFIFKFDVMMIRTIAPYVIPE